MARVSLPSVKARSPLLSTKLPAALRASTAILALSFCRFSTVVACLNNKAALPRAPDSVLTLLWLPNDVENTKA